MLLALYALTSVFFFIPSSGLSALIIHAVGDLITPPREVYKYWKTSPIECVIFFAGVFVSIFTNIENGIYVTVAASGAVLLFRVAKSPGKFLGRVEVHHATRENVRGIGPLSDAAGSEKTHSTFIPLDRSDLSNPQVDIKTPYPGVFIYRFGEGLNYVNCARHLDNLTIYVFKHTRRTQLNKYEKVGDRPWNDPGPRRGKISNNEEMAARPILRAVILDFSAVNFLDVTAAQALIDLRDQFNRYTAPDRVEWHFAGVQNRWTKRALVASGFGYEARGASGEERDAAGRLVAVAEAIAAPSTAEDEKAQSQEKTEVDIEAAAGSRSASSSSSSRGARYVPLYGINRPYFHVDVETALASVVRNLERRGAASAGEDS